MGTHNQPTHIDVPVYLLVEPTWKDRYWKDEQDRLILEGGKVTKATVKRPTVGPRGGVITKVTLRFPASAFLPLQPEAVVEIRPDDSETIIVTVETPDSDPEDDDA